MTIIRAYRTALDPTHTQQAQLRAAMSELRRLWNNCLEQRQALYWNFRVTLSDFDQMKELTAARNDDALPWLRTISRMAQNAIIQNLGRAYAAAFRRIRAKEDAPGFPRFKGRYSRIAWKFFSSVTVDADGDGRSCAVRLTGFGRIKLFERGYLPSGVVKIRSGALTFDGQRWMISITVDEDIDEPRVIPGRIVVVHLGLKKLAYIKTISAGGAVVGVEEIDNPQPLQGALKRLRLLKRRESRRKPGGSNREDARRRRAKFEAHIRQIRLDYLHKMTTEIAERRAETVIVQLWDVAEMLGQKKYSRAIADAAWYEIRRQITYKSEWKATRVIVVPNTEPVSKRCSQCGTVDDRFLLSMPVYRCATCGMVKDRERNALDNMMNYQSASV